MLAQNTIRNKNHHNMTQKMMLAAWSFDGWDEVLYYYWPVLLALILFWPVLVTLIAASVSASAWWFWLCIGAAFSLLQLSYVLYNFMMIIWDVSALTMLKTFAMLRSFVRYYFHKVGDAGWFDLKDRQRHGKRRRTRREWREEVDRATNYEEYCKIELFEPQQKSVVSATVAEPEKRPVALPKSHFGFRLRKCNTNSFSTTNSDASSNPHSPRGPMRKIHSSHELNESPQRFRNSPVNGKDSTNLIFPMRRVSSSAHPFSETNHVDDDNFLAQTESCPRWQQIVKDDLGLTGSMLLTTLSILKEARMKASNNMNGRHDTTSKADRHVTKLDSHDEHLGDGGDNSVGDQLENITASTSRQSNQKNDDYSSTLKTLLSGIVKRNHLSVDDFLMQDARSVAERGQHSLQKETRETIDRYGEEVERCIDWVASGAVYLGIDDENNGTSTPRESQTGNARHYSSPDQIMQKQHDELSKRYILFKRMKQNMGHTALMLSGGGAQAMYHLGTIKALAESNLYQHIHVISGTSGGRYECLFCLRMIHDL